MLSSVRLLLAAMIGLIAFAAPGMAATPIGKVVAVVGSPTSSGRAHQLTEVPSMRMTSSRRAAAISRSSSSTTPSWLSAPTRSWCSTAFLMRGGNRAQKFSVDALRGTFRFISGNSAKNAYDIHTANATIGIRGTGFDFTSGNTTLVAVHEGLVRLCASGRCEAIPGQLRRRARAQRPGRRAGRSRQGPGSELAALYPQPGCAGAALPPQHTAPAAPASTPSRTAATMAAAMGGGGTRSAPSNNNDGGERGEAGGQVD